MIMEKYRRSKVGSDLQIPEVEYKAEEFLENILSFFSHFEKESE